MQIINTIYKMENMHMDVQNWPKRNAWLSKINGTDFYFFILFFIRSCSLTLVSSTHITYFKYMFVYKKNVELRSKTLAN